jgi:hypothetical protein
MLGVWQLRGSASVGQYLLNYDMSQSQGHLSSIAGNQGKSAG